MTLSELHFIAETIRQQVAAVELAEDGEVVDPELWNALFNGIAWLEAQHDDQNG